MRKTLIIIFSIAPLGIFSQGARAEIINLGKQDVAAVRKACGASFQPAADGSGYGCTKSCKTSGGGNGNCTVACDNNNNCKGSTPDRKVPGARPFAGSLNAVLTNKMRMQTDAPAKPVGGPSIKPAPAGIVPCEPPLIRCRGACAAICRAPDSGLLDSGSGFSPQGPSSTGKPAGTPSRGGTIY